MDKDGSEEGHSAPERVAAGRKEGVANRGPSPESSARHLINNFLLA